MIIKTILATAIFAGLAIVVAQAGRTVADSSIGNLYSGYQVEADSHPLLGYWYAEYEEYEIAVTYEFRQENGSIKAYSVEVYDKEGNKISDNSLALNVNSFENGKGKADYFIEYEDEKYEFKSKIKLIEDKLELSYSFYGFDETEVWKKVEL